jgi:hypothetical protein
MLSAHKSWFRASLQDPAFFNAAMSHYAGHFSLVSNRGVTIDSMMLRMKAIKIVNDRIARKDGEISDGTIAAGTK